ncbi:hypothetical protein KKF82_05275 [Patescibacteria group bacterium]|nr:hypothetical protein [Patescibacteria group bacterium]
MMKMPTSGKILRYREDLTLEEMQEKLQGYEYVLNVDDGEYQGDLVSNIEHLMIGDDELAGLFRFDTLTAVHHRSGVKVFAKTTDAPFIFLKYEGEILLVVRAKKSIANSVANSLSMILHGELGTITEITLDSGALEAFCSRAETTKVLLLQDLTIPNLNKLTLYGADVLQTDLHGEFRGEGAPHYFVAKTKSGHTVGIVDDASVTMFDSVDSSQYQAFLEEEIFPMLRGRAW